MFFCMLVPCLLTGRCSFEKTQILLLLTWRCSLSTSQWMLFCWGTKSCPVCGNLVRLNHPFASIKVIFTFTWTWYLNILPMDGTLWMKEWVVSRFLLPWKLNLTLAVNYIFMRQVVEQLILSNYLYLVKRQFIKVQIIYIWLGVGSFFLEKGNFINFKKLHHANTITWIFSDLCQTAHNPK